MTKDNSILFFLLILLFSCDSQETKDLSTYTVSYSNFENIVTIDGVVEPVRSTTLNCPIYIEGVIAYVIEDGTYVEEGDTVCVIEVQELQTAYNQMLLSLENAEAGINKTKAELDMQYALLEAQVKNNEADTQIAQLDSLQLAYSTQNQRRIKELELEKVTIEKAKHQKKLHSLEIIQQSEIRKLELEIQNLRNRSKTMKEQLDALVLKAPCQGLATRAINPLTGNKLLVGDPVWSNMPLVKIPEFNEVKIKIMAPERDYKYINMNDSVYFTFDAMPGNMAFGKIIKKAPMGQPYKRGSKVKLFEVEASVDSLLTLPEPGFTANCHIVLKQIKDTLVVPQIAIFEEDSMKVVYIKRNRGFEMRQVETGLSSPKEAIITAGVQKDEILLLSKPKTSLVKKKTVLPVIAVDSIANPENEVVNK
ncbi:HlyD family secretion protein [Parabacteroides sp. PM5-20]|uniref:efflux RND transporter periplasmic adaptor subunit n=1 Tax=unclassified Parabacteroides TaxID=2649774 RepID=UPI0013D5F230|nr:efflux RND transporter periplasmic adaptor subunit [Parabacteroides sp. PM5-20]MDH6533436.1 HlyD family secretion protein [Parabacteroides sp. PM5-20]